MREWISIDDKFPKEGVSVLTYPFYCRGYFSLVSGWYIELCDEWGNLRYDIEEAEVTHWAELPRFKK